MPHSLEPVTERLESNSGLDILEGFTPTAFEDPSFDGMTTAVLRAHFKKWVTTAPLQEQRVDTCGQSGRDLFFVMVDQEVLESVLNSDLMLLGKLVYGEWEPEPEVDKDGNESVDLEEELEPLEGCM
ncbi:hypothetical protein N7447_007714 [Penicillium robsamsonii]|uniref:uncharacterized protein n=1 Tax=Penicillium robsamsonii TaxID=1792511 RepID=UPI0025479E22|nr:uncharacterized protein N7447_007714 [Penicillium robsamsonii]KAJ5817706.1 hypothetical protein N7447_007714 [Penicillium robsamsonii]